MVNNAISVDREKHGGADLNANGVFPVERKFRFDRKERLKAQSSIQAVFRRGKRFGCKGAKLFALPNDLAYSRVCFTFSRGFGNAVERNRARRLGREAYRLLRPKGGHDLVLLVYPETGTVLANRVRQLEFLFSKAGLLE